MLKNNSIIQGFRWADLTDAPAYQAWRTAKLKIADTARDWAPVEIDKLSRPGDSARAELKMRCKYMNFAHYITDAPKDDPSTTQAALRGFATSLGLRLAETHRSAGKTGIVALQVSDTASKRGFIPYTSRPMNWHTDGYYNAPNDTIAGFVLHCARAASSGGVNQLLDPEIAYLRLRDRDPALVTALMHPQAMTIPENREADGSLRPESTGPVFFADPASGRLQMRYTARTRSISWRDDPATADATTALREILASDDPLVQNLSLSAGHGILNNNILHNRTGFSDDATGAGRLIYRVRFHNRVEEA